MERLQKVIANSGYCSRRKAEELISNGKVIVNGDIVRELGTKVNSSDIIIVEGHSISYEEREYYMLNKPREVISSASDDKGRKTVVDYIETDKRIYPIGRLDYDTTGLILLTNDGDFANKMMKPSNNIIKTYLAKLDSILTKEDTEKLLNGLVIDGVKCIPDRVKIKDIDKKTNRCLVEISIHEGRNHEVRKLFEKLGYNCLKLTRIAYGSLKLGNLRSGEYRHLSKQEINELLQLIKKEDN
ncbi:MAG: rRNA pseudouridine synthase [Bacilli bacterium]|nr:rRNA pseudouridine synthase [Bacilli bacterium]